MGMAQRNAGRGHLGLRGMFSLEPWTIRGCGYPDLLASGEQCHGDAIHDRQHPHDLAMEIAAEYDAPLTGTTAGKSTAARRPNRRSGRSAYPHRVSAMPNPLAPIAHHWLDATHVSFGVVTGGVYGHAMESKRPRSTVASRTRIARTSTSARSIRCPDARGFCQPRMSRCRCPPAI